MKLSKNEIILLMHLADGMQHNDAPKELTPEQFYVAAKSLKEKGMILASILSGEEVYAVQLKQAGQAVLADLKQESKSLLRKILREYDLTQNQYKLLLHTREVGYAENIFGIAWNDYKNEICNKLYGDKYLKSNDNDDNGLQQLVLTQLGEQRIEDIEDELNTLLSGYSKSLDDSSTDTTIIFERKGPKGELLQKRITAREICDSIRGKDYRNNLKKEEWMDLLSTITGLSSSSFKSYL